MGRSSKLSRGGGRLGYGIAAALLLHVHVLAPLLVAVFSYAAREEAERPEEVDIGFENVPAEALPPDLPPLGDDTPPPQPPPKLAEKDKEKEKEKARKRPELAEQPPTPPEPEVKPPPPEPAPPPEQKPPTPPEPPKAHEKMVDLDNEKDVEPPPDAKYLAQKNNRAEVETRATQTNLEREQKGEEGSQADNERRDDPEVGDERAKIAELEDTKSLAGRKAPDLTPHTDPEVPQPDQSRPSSSVMALRQAMPRRHELTPETADPSLPRDPAGTLAMPRPAMPALDDEAGRPSQGKRLKLALSGHDYEYLFGAEAKTDRQLAQKERSTRLGKHAARAARVRAALENFIPEVQPGNQTALNTRAAPFAAFIARMHRSIHKLWGFGVLEEWDELPSSSPFNNDALMNKIEIVLNGDGTVSKVTVVQASRYVGYDAAAVDAVYSAGPYPDPPREIRSGNGKIYIHWSFHRDGRQCATSGVDYFILNNAPADRDRGDRDGEAVAQRPPAAAPAAPPPRAPEAAAAPDGSRAGGGSGDGDERPRRLARNLGEPSGAGVEGRRPGGAGPAPGSGGGRFAAAEEPAHEGEHAHPHRHAPGDGEAAKVAAPASAPPGGGGDAGRPQNRNAATTVAADWFAAYARGDVGAMTARASFPFRSSAGIAAKTRDELARMFKALIAESPQRTAARVTVETSAGLRRMMGKLPPGLDDGSGLLFAVSSVDGDALILMMAQTPSGWKTTGLVRR